MRHLSRLFIVIAAVLLTACGGSSNRDQLAAAQSTGTTTTTPTTPVALFTNAPSAITMSSGAAPATFTVGGGTLPYAASSANLAIAKVTISGTTLTVTSGSVGVATVVVLDSVGAKVEIAVTVGSTAQTSPLRTQAPSALTLAVGNERSYPVTGGDGPYAANSANEAVAKASISAGTLTLQATGVGTTQILVLDGVGAQVVIGVTVGGPAPAPLLLVAPSAVTISTGALPASYAITGGTPPYSAQTSNTAIVSAAVSGASLNVAGTTLGSATVTVFDAAGGQASVLVNVSSSTGAALSTLPSGASGNVGDSLSFSLQGGSPGYSLSISNTAIAALSESTVATSGGRFTATLRSVGEAIVTVRDSLSQTTSFVISVSSTATQLRLSPNTFLVGENDLGEITLNIFGGTPPYRAITSDLVKSAVTVDGSMVKILPGSSGNRCINPVTDADPPVYIVSGTYDVTLTVLDSQGATATSIMNIKDNGAGLGQGCP